MDWYSIKLIDDRLSLVDQRVIPKKIEYYSCRTYQDVIFAIKDMVVRGAPAIGIAGAYGYYLGFLALGQEKDFMEKMMCCEKELIGARPTAVNLEWAVLRMKAVLLAHQKDGFETIKKRLKIEGDAIHQEDILMNIKMGEIGSGIVPENANILTHCNTGALATGGYGTALGVIKKAFELGKVNHVYADETRPRLQGGRLTAFELVQAGIPSTLTPDLGAAVLMRDGLVDLIIVGADRIALNGDTANKIGTYGLSVLAKTFNIPFYIAAPTSTIDYTIETGAEIEIEYRDKREVTQIEGIQIAPEEIAVFNPSFDVTPHENITGIITEKGIFTQPFKKTILEGGQG